MSGEIPDLVRLIMAIGAVVCTTVIMIAAIPVVRVRWRQTREDDAILRANQAAIWAETRRIYAAMSIEQKLAEYLSLTKSERKSIARQLDPQARREFKSLGDRANRIAESKERP
ncbi:Uncharacterised protein [Mycobacteroides abscessus subsp. bolletii]|uniref:hypothetical protein n=1 Tax=Mycobacteroides abscessus TaxID=36809 RepID=UPI0009A81E13|nr:hypothetical protein [Mycobacteroides abscessus]SKZ04211.1 Uncharacterised protein [Mycobacteroides abscessus subsp. bolletii]